jgi:cobalt/nickel transport system permease protein
MSSSMVSKHIPDLNLITYYAEKQDSVFSHVSPWTKLAVLVLLILFITLSRNLVIIIGLYLAVLAVYVLAHLPVRKLFSWYLLPLIFVLSLVGIMAWMQPGIPVISFEAAGIPLTMTDQGIVLVVTLVLKAFISVTYSLFFLMTTRYEHFSGMIYRIFPAPLDQIFLMAYRFLFLTLSMIGSMLKAVRSRGGGLIRSVRMQSRMFAEVFAMVFIRSFERAERVQKAMDARGYNGKYITAVRIPRPGIWEYAVLAGFVMVMILTNWIVPFQGW